MEDETLHRITSVLFLRFGLHFNADFRVVDGFNEVHLLPEFSDISEGFKIVVRINWKRLNCSFVPGPRSGLLLHTMGSSSVENRFVFSSVAEEIISKRGTVELLINGFRQNPGDSQNWPSVWSSLYITSMSSHIETEFDLSVDKRLDEFILEWAGLFFSMIFTLLPVDSPEERDDQMLPGELEGLKIQSISTRYERSRKNRQVCLAAKGYKCTVCNFDFEETYGVIGAGYIEVHHIIPVSSLDDNYLINPVKDLVPLCSNCHAMIHRREPPYLVEELKDIYRSMF